MLIKLDRKAKNWNEIKLSRQDIIKDQSAKILHDEIWSNNNIDKKQDLNYFEVDSDTFVFLTAKKGEDMIPVILGVHSSNTKENICITISDYNLKDLKYNEYKATILFYNGMSDAPSISIDCDLVIDSTLPNPKKETVLPPDEIKDPDEWDWGDEDPDIDYGDEEPKNNKEDPPEPDDIDYGEGNL